MPGLIILMIGCVVFMAWSIYKIAEDRHFSKICERTEGVVIDTEQYYTDDNDERYAGVYEYSVDGVTYEVEEKEWHLSEPELGDTAMIYYDPEDPEDARFYVGGFDSILKAAGYSMFCMVGAFFFLIALAMILAHYKTPDPWIQILVGSAFALLGISVPILTKGAGCVLIIFGLIGIYLIVRGYLQLRGKHEEDQAFQDQVGAMVGGVVKGLAGAQTDGFEQPQTSEVTPEDVISAADNLGKKLEFIRGIKNGIGTFIFGLILLIIGIGQIVLNMSFIKIIGIIFVIVGLLIMIFGIRRIERDGDRRNYYMCVYKYWVADVSYTVERRESFRPEFGDVEILYYDPENPEDARFYTNVFSRILNDVMHSALCLAGAFFFFFNLTFIMARCKVATPWILIIEGTLLTIMGISVPILTKGAGGILIIGILVGICVCVLGYQQLRDEKKVKTQFQKRVDDMMDAFFEGMD